MKKKPAISRRGSALVFTLVLALMLMVIVHSLLSRIDTERRVNTSHLESVRVNNALDATLDFALGQIVARKRYAAVDGLDAFTPKGGRALQVLPKDLYGDSTATRSQFDFQSLEVVGSQVVPIRNTDPRDPMAKVNNGKWLVSSAAMANANDPMKGQYVDRFLCGVLATGVINGSGGPKRAYGVAFLERRDAYLFNYAVFFSANPLRMQTPGGLLQLGGAVFANEGIFFRTQGDSDIRFLGTVSSATGIWDRPDSGMKLNSAYLVKPDGSVDIERANKWDVSAATSNTTTSSVGKVQFADSNGVLQSLADAERSGVNPPWWITTPSVDFANKISKKTNNTIQTAAHGVQPVVPMGVSPGVGVEWVQDPTRAVGLFDNPTDMGRYNLSTERAIDPVRTGVLDAKLDLIDDPAEREQLQRAKEIEQGKIALKASIYTVVERDGTVTAFNNPDLAISYKKVPQADRAKWRSKNESNILDVSPFINKPQLVSRTTTKGGKSVDLKPVPTNTLYDWKQGGTVTVVELDVGKMTDAIRGGSDKITFADGHPWNTEDKKPQDNAKYASSESKQGWNGVIYFDVEAPLQKFEGVPSLKEWKDGVGSSAALADKGYTAIRLANATEVPSARVGEPGFTVATNAPVYIKGSFNADGNMATGSSSRQDDQSTDSDRTAKIPAAIWSDFAVIQDKDFQDLAGLTVVKPAKVPAGLNAEDLEDANWPFYGYDDRANSNGSKLDYAYRNLLKDKSLEISAAVVSGERAGADATHAYPTGNGLQSFIGYMENYDRASSQFRVRGALVNLWTPRVFAGNFNGTPSYYWNPTRDFGYSSLFAKGVMPPGTPVIRDYKKVRFMAISPELYEKMKRQSDPAKWVELLVKSGM